MKERTGGLSLRIKEATRLRDATLMTLTALTAFALLILLPMSVSAQPGPKQIAAMVEAENLRSGIASLSAIPSRVVGYDEVNGRSRSATWVNRQFHNIGLANVREEGFRVTVPVERQSTLVVDGSGAVVKLRSMWPNSVRTNQTPKSGIKGNLIYCGKSELSSFNGKDVLGSIVLLDMDCGTAWFSAMILGARAVIFIESPSILRGEAESKYLSAPVNIPRYFVDRATGGKLKSLATGTKVTVRTEMDWENRMAINVIGEIPGSDPKLKDEWVILEAYYDAMSVVPSLAPGAEQACGIASMLEVTRVLKSLRPKRSILVVATSGHFQALAGIREFFYRRLPPDPSPDQKKQFAKYKAFIAFDLTSQSDVFGTFYKGHFIDQPENMLQWKFADIGTLLREKAQAAAPLIGLPGTAYVDGINPIQGKNWRTYLPAKLAIDNEIANLVALPGLALVTANDARVWVNSPQDTVGRVNIDSLTKQVKLAACILPSLINSTDPELLDVSLDNTFYRVSALLAEFDPKKSYIPDQPVGGSLGVMHRVPAGEKTFCGVAGSFVVKTAGEGKDKGRFVLVGVPSAAARQTQWRIDGFELDARTGEIIKALDRGTNGEEIYPAEISIDVPNKQVTLVLFACKGVTVYDMVDQRRFSLLQKLYVYDAQTEAEPFAFGYSLPELPPSASLYEPVAVIYAPPGEADKPGTRIKVTMGADILGLRFVLINSTRKNYLGSGFNVDEYDSIPFTPYQVAMDMWNLDEHRIRTLEEHGIANDRVNDLHKIAGELLVEAREQLELKRYDRFLANVRAAWSYESRAYPDVQKTANDVVKGIMFYLALLLPFAFFTERLFFSFPDIRKQIVGASGIFLLVFLVIQAVHPAFAITTTPIIILLAFIILALTAIVSSIVIQKFENEMRAMKLETGAIHSADVGRISATAAAFSLGISNMRRRKARTSLTCVTLILLTFTVLSFTSVVTRTKVNKIDMKHASSYNGIMMRQQAWEPLGEPMASIVKNEFGDRYPVAPRAWYLSALVGERSYVTVEHGGKSYSASALVGLSPREREVRDVRRLLAGRWFEEGERLVCIIPSGMAKQLGISVDDIGTTTAHVLGSSLQVIGIVDSEKMKEFKDLDGEILTPVDYNMMQQEQRQQQGTQKSTMGELEEYVHMMPDSTLFVPYDFVILHGGDLRSVTIGFPDGKSVQESLKGLMERIELNVYAGADGKTYLCSALAQTTPVGLLDLMVPIAIVALIVLNTMLGSVFERTNEIGIFGALGLAPVHISALFIAEACVYAILGAISGYVFGQVLSKVIVDYNLSPGLNLNYSSLSTVGSTLIVMVTVLLSTLYPARKAAEMSVPDVERRWKLPDPEGDYLRVGLPFTVSASQSLGINAFMRQYFEAHTDYSVGNFSTGDVTFQPHRHEQGDGYRLGAMLWLAPYDLGVSAHLTIDTVPTDDAWVNEVQIIIRRESGDESSWLRVTRNFLNILRKQYLIWRICTPEVKAEYQVRGEEALRSEPTEPEVRGRSL